MFLFLFEGLCKKRVLGISVFGGRACGLAARRCVSPVRSVGFPAGVWRVPSDRVVGPACACLVHRLGQIARCTAARQACAPLALDYKKAPARPSSMCQLPLVSVPELLGPSRSNVRPAVANTTGNSVTLQSGAHNTTLHPEQEPKEAENAGSQPLYFWYPPKPIF